MQWKSWRKYSRTPNTGLAKVAVQCSADTFVVHQGSVLRINICGENRHLRKALAVMPHARNRNNMGKNYRRSSNECNNLLYLPLLSS